MSDTVGSLIDKLITIDFKMWNNQELLYDIRNLTLEEFKSRYNLEDLYSFLHKACDLNLQRNNLIDEIDLKIIEMIDSNKSLDDGKYIQRKYKTYDSNS